MEQIRSFIAVELPDETKLKLKQLEAQLKSGRRYAMKWVAPDSIHLTLKFLGNIAIDRTGEITGAIEEAARGISPFQVNVTGLGVFPNSKRVQVTWVGLDGQTEKLVQLQQNIESGMEKLGFIPEKRRFTPHLTVARFRDHASPGERQDFGQLIASISFDAGPFIVDSISLMKSQLTREGAIYTRISSIKLI
jgi:2'-5' RNA ligase